MKKNLLLPLIALALVACGGATTSAGTPSETPSNTPTTVAPSRAETITIDKDDQAELKAAIEAEGESVYHASDVAFETDGTKWAYNANCGLANAEYNSEYNSRGVFQLKKNDGAMFNTEALVPGYTTVTVKFFATYATQDTKYLPVVSQGLAADALEAVTANEEAPVAGTDAGFIGSGSYQAYDYTVTYTISAEATFLKIAAGAGAFYLQSVVIA